MGQGEAQNKLEIRMFLSHDFYSDAQQEFRFCRYTVYSVICLQEHPYVFDCDTVSLSYLMGITAAESL